MPTTYAIPDGRTAFAATTYTGTGVTGRAVSNAVNGVSMQPDLVWVKSRTSGTYNTLYDSVRGVSLRLFSNDTAAEADFSPYGVTAFSSGGFTVSDITSSGYGVNENGVSYVAWNWKAGGTAVTNTAGSITSQVSANTTAGFSVVTYTGNGTSGATIGHGLGATASFIILKRRNGGSGYSWYVQHPTLGPTKALFLDSTNTGGTSVGYWNNTAPTSTVFSVGNDTSLNASGGTYVAYCWAAVPGYSAFGSYTGNGSTDGPFVYLGFRPRFIMFKRTDSANVWSILDSTRDTYNVTNLSLQPNNYIAEETGKNIDYLSNGFKQRQTDGGWNASGGTYIYAAFAENPFKYANAR
jgi:hypothetical protein